MVEVKSFEDFLRIIVEVGYVDILNNNIYNFENILI